MTRQSKINARSLRRHLFLGVAASVLIGGGIAAWAATTGISGAVVAPSLLVVDSNVKKVQHPTGGIVGDLLVRDGDEVRAGDLLVRLDETLTRASLSIVTKGLDELAARQARLAAERDGALTISYPESLLARQADPAVAEVMNGERSLFEFRRTAREGQKAQLGERVTQLKEEIRGLTGQEVAKGREISLMAQELEGVRELWRKNLVPISRITNIEREAARLEGERGSLVATMAQARVKITETQLQIIQIDQELRSEGARELREIQTKGAELVERKIAAEDGLKRIEIRAPIGGRVHQMAVHTIGGVIGPAEPILLVVPDADNLTVEARVAPQDRDQLRMGQPAFLRFSAFNQQTTPEIDGTVGRIGADLTTDQATGASYYVVRINLPPEEMQKLGELKLVPGMPVEAFIQTGDRTVASYLVKPLMDQIAKAWRED